jgi:thiol:disulfide interchange protein
MKNVLVFIFISIFTPIIYAGEEKKIDWNEAQINWLSYEDGINVMKAENKKGILLLYADWCSTCAEYSAHFKNEKIVHILKNMVVMKANVDHNPEVRKFVEYDEKYVPKTIGLNSSGEPLKQIYKENAEYMFFVPLGDPKDTYKFLKKIENAKNI